MKYLFFFLILLLTLHLGSVRIFDEYLLPGQELGLLVNVINYDGIRDEPDDLEDVQVSVYIPGLWYYKSGSFDLDDGDVASKLVFESVPGDAQPGDYLARISITYIDPDTHENTRESAYRYITVV